MLLEIIILYYLQLLTVTRASLVALLVKRPPAMQETPILYLGWEDPLEKESTIHSLPLEKRSATTPVFLGFPGGSASLLQCGRPGFDPWVGKIPCRRKQLPIPVFWPGEFQGLYSPWGPKESNTTEWFSLSPIIGQNTTWFQTPEWSLPLSQAQK